MKASDVQQEIDRMTQNRTTIMNEKLTQIAKQAQVEHCISHARLQEFAELIVRECMEVVINGKYSATECEGNSHRISYNNGRYGASSDIKKHFGVEE